MFADPQSLTVTSGTKSLVRVNQDSYSSEYYLRTTTEEFSLLTRNTTRFDKALGVSIDRHNVQFINTVFAVPGTSPTFTRKAYLVFENQQGDSLTDVANHVLGLLGNLAASSGANIMKLTNRES